MGKRDQPRDPKTGKWVRRGGFGLGAAAIAISIAALGGGLGATGAVGGAAGGGSSVSSGGSGSGSAASRSGRGSSEARTVRARDRTQSAVARRLAREGRDVRRRHGDVTTDCAAVSYGQVRAFFTATPCDAVGRALFDVREGGARVVVAVAVVDMPSVDGAVALKRLVDTHGTGNVRELRTPRGVRWTGRHYHSARDATTVVNAQAEPVGPGAAAARLAGRVAREAGTG